MQADSRKADHPGWDERTVALLGENAAARLRQARVLVAGLGGVGGYAAEMLVRAGIGALTVIDADSVSVSNLNRQLIATIPNIGRHKAILFADRFHDINPDAAIDARVEFIDAACVGQLLDEGYDYVIDAIDTVAPKVALLSACLLRRVPVISSMGAGGRIDPTRVTITDLWQTRDDGLARAVRQRFRRDGLRRPLKVVASTEPPRRSALIEVSGERNKRSSAGTIATVPATFGIFLASHVINRLTRAATP